MEDHQKLTITPAAWSEEAAAALAEVGSAKEYKRQFDAGAALFEVCADLRRVGWYLLRVDMTAEGTEGVLVAGVGSLPGVDLTAELMPHIEKQFIGCVSMRIHTKRAGLVKKLALQGFGSPEWVLRKKLCG